MIYGCWKTASENLGISFSFPFRSFPFCVCVYVCVYMFFSSSQVYFLQLERNLVESFTLMGKEDMSIQI